MADIRVNLGTNLAAGKQAAVRYAHMGSRGRQYPKAMQVNGVLAARAVQAGDIGWVDAQEIVAEGARTRAWRNLAAARNQKSKENPLSKAPTPETMRGWKHQSPDLPEVAVERRLVKQANINPSLLRYLAQRGR